MNPLNHVFTPVCKKIIIPIDKALGQNTFKFQVLLCVFLFVVVRFKLLAPDEESGAN
jgi:hypothetical protein